MNLRKRRNGGRRGRGNDINIILIYKILRKRKESFCISWTTSYVHLSSHPSTYPLNQIAFLVCPLCHLVCPSSIHPTSIHERPSTHYALFQEAKDRKTKTHPTCALKKIIMGAVSVKINNRYPVK